MNENGKTQYPDISDILAQKAEARRIRAKRTFGQKVAAMEALRERLKPFKKERNRLRAERSKKK